MKYQEFDKNELIDSKYEVIFPIDCTEYYQRYRVKDRKGEIHFLKLYNSSKLSAYQLQKGIFSEIDILSGITNENIIKLEDKGNLIKNNQKFHYLVFRFYSGETLADKLSHKGNLSEYTAIPAVIDVLSGLKDLHEHQRTIIHNNVNPAAIYLDYSSDIEIPILTNFEHARYIEDPGKTINLEQLNPFYVAPELFNGIFTPQSDLFSVGILLYHLIVGIPPWYVELSNFKYTAENLKEAVLEERKKPFTFGFSELELNISEYTKSVIRKAVNPDIEKRFKNCQEFIIALKREIDPESLEVQGKAQIEKLRKKRGNGFSDIVGMNNIKQILNNDIIRALTEQERFKKYDIPLPNGMLLYGPPGCGKTFIAEKFAEEIGFNFIKVISSDIASKYIHGTQEKISQLFSAAEKNSPTVIFIDEIDGIAPNRSSVMDHAYASEVNELLAQFNNCSERGIFVIAATNRPEIIDEALTRAGRIDYKIYVPPPDHKAREGLFRKYLIKRPVDQDIDYVRLADLTDSFICVDIKLITDLAARNAEKEDTRISQTILESIISEFRPSISFIELKKYELIHKKFTDIQIEKKRNIGFRSENE